ncbi:unnamed protein product [Paramecium pentaurelia]|uniref:EGF-like domain-containing protein n=1 Tax=Paramecium pentaurelia TaxID=43138 RepID=A0A8S1XY01_9CILI|nr:unnamed protein product [Paramecium pentaurelia]
MFFYSLKDCLLIILFTQLTLSCSDGQFNLLGECENCLFGCKICPSADDCTTCFDGKFKQTIIGVDYCMPCSSYCKKCTSASVCQLCQDHYYLNGNSCVQCAASCGNCQTTSTNCISCTVGFLSNTQCISCTTPCLTCVDNSTKCTSCIDNNKNAIDYQCVCKNGYYQDGSNVCNLCNYPCSTCLNNANFCTNCQTPFQLSSTILNTCECQAGYYQDINQTCQQCLEPCKTCQQSVTYCLSCVDVNQDINYTNNTCFCKTGWIFDLNNINCVQCQLPCIECIETINKCITCNDVIHQQGETCSCESGWINDQNYICIQCEKPCKTCSLSTNQCLTCEDPNHYLNESQSCVCKPGYFSNTLSTCLKCQEPCNECNINGCINCIDINQVLDSNFICICKDNYYMNGINCYQCQQPCYTCIDSYDKCLTCLDPNQQLKNYQCECKSNYNKIQDICCHKNCEYCLGIDNCNKCRKGYFLNGKSTCLQCIENCEFCTNQIRCETCINGFFVDIYGQCISCKTNCKNCTNQQDCIQCNEGYYIQENECLQCNENCKSCINSSEICLSCRLNYEINPFNNNCQCLNGYYELDNQCKQCIYPCIQCFNSDECKECAYISNIFLNEQNKCQCNQGYYFYEKHCLSCDSTCQTCVDNSMNCLTCDYDKFRIFIGNSCLCINNYFENENKICMSCNSDQGKVIQSCKYKNSTDFIWTYGEECDDGNQINRDGCSNTLIDQNHSCFNIILQKSICFQCPSHCIKCELDLIKDKPICNKCESGYFLDLNQCVQCQRNCLECINTPFNCLTCRYLRNQMNQCLNCEISMGYYIDEQNLKCYSKCGDGIKTEEEECDDGNNLKNDGCNSLCQLEKYYILQNNISIIPVYPKPYLQSLGNSQLYSNNRQFKLSYNVELIIKDDFQIKDYISLHISKEQIIQPIDQQFELIQSIQQLDEPGKAILSLKISISFNRSSRDESLLIRFHNNTKFVSYLGYPQLDNEIKCIIPKLIFIEDTTILQVKITTQSNSYILYFIGAIFGGSVFFGGINVFYNLLDNLQMLSYFKYLNIEFPYNLNMYFDIFGFAQINFIQKIFDISGFLDKIIDLNQLKQSPKKIAIDNLTPLFLINMSTILTIWISLGGIYQISKVIPKFLNSIKIKFYSDFNQDSWLIKIGIYYLKIKNIIIKICFMITSELFYSGLLRVHMTTAYDYTFSIALQLYSIELYSQNGLVFLSSYIGLLATGFYLINIYYIIQISEMNKYAIKSTSVKQKYGSVFEGLQHKPISKYFNSILLIKKLIFMIILVFAYEFPPFQVCSITLLSVLMSLFIIIFKPLDDFSEYIKQLSCEISITFTLIFIIFLTINNELQFLTYEIEQKVGWVCIFFMTSLLCIQLVVDTIQQWKFLYKRYKQIRNLVNAFLRFAYPPEPKKATFKILE